MITLPSTKYGTKRKAIISGFAQWDHLNLHAEVLFYVQLLNEIGTLLDDKSLNQNRAVVYSLNNLNRVNAQFDTIESGGTGEYDFFFNMVSNPANGQTIVDILILLGEKLKTRGIFE